MSILLEIEAATDALPREQKAELLRFESLETSLRRAINDFKLNYEDYIRNYLQN
jgi:hypothetical protein